MWPWKTKTGDESVTSQNAGLLEPKQCPPMPEVTVPPEPAKQLKCELKIFFLDGNSMWFTCDVSERETPEDFGRFMSWLHRTRGPKHVQDSFFSIGHKDGSSSVRLSTIKGASVRFFEEIKKC